MDFQQKYLTEKRDDTSPSRANPAKDAVSANRGYRSRERLPHLEESESPVAQAADDLSGCGADSRKPFEARNKTTINQQNQKNQQLTRDSSHNSWKTNTVVTSHHSKAQNTRQTFNKTLSAPDSNQSANQMPQKSKTEHSENLSKSKGFNSHNRIFTRAKESIDKHVTIDLYQAVYGDDSSASGKPTITQSDQLNEQSKSVQNANSQYNVTTMPASSNTSKVTSPSRKRNSGGVHGPQNVVQNQYNQLGQFRIPCSKYAKSSTTKTRNNTKIKANTIIAQLQTMGDGPNGGSSPVRQRALAQTMLFQKVHTQRTKQQTEESRSAMARKNAEARSNQAKLFNSNSGGRLGKQLSPVNSTPTASLQAQQLGHTKIANSRKNMKSHETLKQKKNPQAVKLSSVLRPCQQQATQNRPSNPKASRGVTPKSSIVTETAKNRSSKCSKSPLQLRPDKASFTQSNLSGKTRHEQNLMRKFQTNRGTIQNPKDAKTQHNFQNSHTSPKLANQTAFSSNLSVTRCQPSQKKSYCNTKQNGNRARLENDQPLEGQRVSLVNDWQMPSSGQEGLMVDNGGEIQEVHIQVVDDASDINPLNRTNNQENERIMKLSELKVQHENQFSQTMLLPSAAHPSEQKSQVTLFSPHYTNSNVSPNHTAKNRSPLQLAELVNPAAAAPMPDAVMPEAVSQATKKERYSQKRNDLSSQAFTVVAQDLDSNYAVINFNNNLCSSHEDENIAKPLHTEGEKQDNGPQVNKFSMVEENREQGVKSAMIVLSSGQQFEPEYDREQQRDGSRSRSDDDYNRGHGGRRLGDDGERQQTQQHLKTVVITGDGHFADVQQQIDLQMSSDNTGHEQALQPADSNQPNMHGTAHFKAGSGKQTNRKLSPAEGGASLVAVRSSSAKKDRQSEQSSSSSLVVIESPVPKIINEPNMNLQQKANGGPFALHGQPPAFSNRADTTGKKTVTLGPGLEVSHEGGAYTGKASSSSKGPQQRFTPSPRLASLPYKEHKSQRSKEKSQRSSERQNTNTKNGNTDTMNQLLGPELNPQIKVYDDGEQQMASNGYGTELNSNQIVETGRFDQGIGSTVKKVPKYDEEFNNNQFELMKANQGDDFVVPELNLSPRSDTHHKNNMNDPHVIRNTQRRLFENIQAHYVNTSGHQGLNNSRSNLKSHSTRLDDKLLQQNGVTSQSNSQNSISQNNTAMRKKRQQQNQQFLKKSSLLAKSLVEDASEDFSNIEEHISTFYNNQGTAQTGTMTGPNGQTMNEEEMRARQSTHSDQNNKDKIIVDKLISIYPGDMVSRTQALRHDCVGQSTNFGSTLDNPRQYDENDNNNHYLKNTPLSGASKHQGLLGPSPGKAKKKQIASSNPQQNKSEKNASTPLGKKKLSTPAQQMKVSHNAQNISQNYGRQVPRSLFAKTLGDNTANNSQRPQQINSNGGNDSSVSRQYGCGQPFSNPLTTNPDHSKDASQVIHSNSRHIDWEDREIDVKDSFKESNRCSNSILCGYQSGRQQSQNPTVNLSKTHQGSAFRSHRVSNEVRLQHQPQDTETINNSPNISQNINYSKNNSRGEQGSEQLNQSNKSQKRKGKGIKDLVTSVQLNQPHNNLLVQTNQKNIPIETQKSPTVSSPQTISSTSPLTKGSGSGYSPGPDDEMPSMYLNQQKQTPSNFEHSQQEINQSSQFQAEKPPESEPQTKSQPNQPSSEPPAQQQQAESELHKNHLIQTMQSLHYMKVAVPPDMSVIEKKSVELPPSPFKKTIIFDLDETLVHCVDDIENLPYDLGISVQFSQGERIDAGINVRPYVYECLKQAKKSYQVVIFTASHQSYADAVLDTLEEEFKKPKYLTAEEERLVQEQPPNQRDRFIQYLKKDQKLIDYRLYREHCYKTTENVFIKDLRILKNKDLSQVILVDNAVYSFGFQLSNGIPIIPFYDSHTTNINDEELVHLVYYFNCIVESEDMRLQNRRAFQLEDLKTMDIAQQLKIIQSGSGNNSQVQEEEANTNRNSNIIDETEPHDNDEEGSQELHSEYGNGYPGQGYLPSSQHQAYKQNINDLGHNRGRVTDNNQRAFEHNGTIPELEEDDEDEDSVRQNQNNKAQIERRKKAQQQQLQTTGNSSQESSRINTSRKISKLGNSANKQR